MTPLSQESYISKPLALIVLAPAGAFLPYHMGLSHRSESQTHLRIYIVLHQYRIGKRKGVTSALGELKARKFEVRFFQSANKTKGSWY